MFEREDWTLFRTLTTLGQKAGVPVGLIPKLVAKELADNALDAADSCYVGLCEDGRNGFWVFNIGDGIPGDDAAVAAMFSVKRNLVSSKVLRKPTRGALGNGLRVVAGAVLATEGTLTIATGGRVLRLIPDPITGETRAERMGDHKGDGTRIEVVFGPALEVDEDCLEWARRAIHLKRGESYQGKTSPWWYDSEAFLELLRASGPRTVRELIEEFEGCSGAKAGRIAAPYRNRLARDLDPDEADALLDSARAVSRPVNADRLGSIETLASAGFPAHYQVRRGEFTLPSWSRVVRLPGVIEAWAESCEGRPCVEAHVNRSPITAEISLEHRDKGKTLALFGCNLRLIVAEKVRGSFRVCFNVSTPFLPITSDGKAPDFGPLAHSIAEVIGKAVRKAQNGPRPKSSTIKDVILAVIPEAINKASGGGEYRFSLRQLYYAVRPSVIEAFGKEPEYDYFSNIITAYEAEHGEIPGMYRDPRGTIYHPHTQQEIPLGTISVEQYERPRWTFNKILYCEKEGFFPILKSVGWPERNDCALVSSKGFASRAVKDVFDLLGSTNEEITFYCIHDADAYGTMIYQSLQEETKARPGRKVRVVNLGLDPAEAVGMDLQIEAVNRKGDRAAPVADYIEPEWNEWLQTKRVELNAMTTPQFLAWLEAKFAAEPGKVVPPSDVLRQQLEADARDILRARITTLVLRRAGIDERVERAVGRRAGRIQEQAETIAPAVRARLAARPVEWWKVAVHTLARAVARPCREVVMTGVEEQMTIPQESEV